MRRILVILGIICVAMLYGKIHTNDFAITDKTSHSIIGCIKDTPQEQSEIIRDYLFSQLVFSSQEEENTISRIPTRTIQQSNIQRQQLHIIDQENLLSFRRFSPNNTSIFKLLPNPKNYFLFNLGRLNC